MKAIVAALTGAVGMALCQWLVYLHAPTEATMGLPQKIFYLHLPLAWWALISFLLVFIFSIAYLWKHRLIFDQICAAAAEIGILLATLALATGMIWARLSWGIWWTWDPRLTTTLIMWFIYAAYLVLRNTDFSPERKRTLCAFTGIIAFLDVPLVFFSARIFRSIHPAVFGSSGGGMEPEMLFTLMSCLLFWGCIWFALLWTRTSQLATGANLEKMFHSLLDEDQK